MGGSADLDPSTKTYLKNCGDFEPGNYAGRNIHMIMITGTIIMITATIIIMTAMIIIITIIRMNILITTHICRRKSPGPTWLPSV